MVRNLVLAAALGAACVSFAPVAATADSFSFGIDVGPVGHYSHDYGDRYYRGGHGGGYAPVYGGYSHRYDDGPRWRYDRPRYGYGHYRPRPRYAYRQRPNCRFETVRSWNGYRYTVRERKVCVSRYRY